MTPRLDERDAGWVLLVIALVVILWVSVGHAQIRVDAVWTHTDTLETTITYQGASMYQLEIPVLYPADVLFVHRIGETTLTPDDTRWMSQWYNVQPGGLVKLQAWAESDSSLWRKDMFTFTATFIKIGDLTNRYLVVPAHEVNGRWDWQWTEGIYLPLSLAGISNQIGATP